MKIIYEFIFKERTLKISSKNITDFVINFFLDYKSNLVNIIRYIEVMRISESGKFSKNDLKAFEEGYPTESLTLKIIPGLNSFPQLFLERT